VEEREQRPPRSAVEPEGWASCGKQRSCPFERSPAAVKTRSASREGGTLVVGALSSTGRKATHGGRAGKCLERGLWAIASPSIVELCGAVGRAGIQWRDEGRSQTLLFQCDGSRPASRKGAERKKPSQLRALFCQRIGSRERGEPRPRFRWVMVDCREIRPMTERDPAPRGEVSQEGREVGRGATERETQAIRKPSGLPVKLSFRSRIVRGDF
jgi:hypothetical protein